MYHAALRISEVCHTATPNTYYSTVMLLIVNANLLSNSNYLHTSTVKIHLLRLEYHVPNPLKGYTTITYIYALATQVHFSVTET